MMAGIYVLSGVSTVIENLSDQLDKKGLEVTIGALSFKSTLPNGNYNVENIPLYNISKLKRFLNSFDILHSHHPSVNYLTLLSSKPFIYHYHGVPNLGKRYLRRFNMICSIKGMKNFFNGVITVSESGKRELKRLYKIEKAFLIYNGVDTNRFRHNLDERFRKGEPQFLFVGNLYKHKKVEELILALKEVVKIYPKAHLQIVGEGYAYTLLDTLIKKFHLQDHVNLAGSVSDFDLPFYYSSCDVYVTASQWELFGLPLLEAMACGKPIVASSIPAHIELLSKSKAGIIYSKRDIEDLCKKMVKIYEEKDKYRNNTIKFAKEHDWSFVADRVLRLYDKTI